MIVTSLERALDLRQPPVVISAWVSRVCSGDPAWNYVRRVIHDTSGIFGREKLFGMAGIEPADVDIISSYDAFSFTALSQLEGYGFCGKGEGGEFVKGGRLRIDHELPCNLSGGNLSEAYTNGASLIIENVRQLRRRADDFCLGWAQGQHSYDRGAGCRQARQPQIAACLGWATETYGSALILTTL